MEEDIALFIFKLYKHMVCNLKSENDIQVPLFLSHSGCSFNRQLSYSFLNILLKL